MLGPAKPGRYVPEKKRGPDSSGPHLYRLLPTGYQLNTYQSKRAPKRRLNGDWNDGVVPPPTKIG
jgi:hypothetical protein